MTNKVLASKRSADSLVDGTTNKAFLATERTKLASIEALADVTDAANVDAAGAVMNSDTTTAAMSFVIDEDNLASNLDTKVPTQQSVKAYVTLYVNTVASTLQPLDADLTALAAMTAPATKLAGIAAGATVNDTDANLKARANHTGTQTASTISDFNTAVRTNRLDQMALPTATVDFNSRLISNLLDPVGPQDAGTKNYIDMAIQGLTPKPTATVVAVSALPAGTYSNGSSGVGATFTVTATGTTTVDGHVLALNELVLLTAQASALQNGLYTVTTAGTTGVSTVLTRHAAMNVDSEISGAFVPVSNVGATHPNSLWMANPSGAVTIGTTAIPFAEINRASDLTQGTGITISGNVVSIENGGVLLATHGGTGATSASGARTNLGLAIGADVQAFNSNLSTIAGLTPTTNNFMVGVSSAWASRTPAQVKTTLALDLVDNTSDITKNLVIANTQTASYTLVLGDAAKAVEMNVASANNLTVPLNSSVAFPIGTVIEIYQYGAGQTTIVATGGVTIRSSGGKLKLTGQYSSASLRKRATDEWVLVGDLAA